MKTNGNITTFEHVQSFKPGLLKKGCAMIVAEFDGELDEWWTQIANPTDPEIKLAVDELQQYYKRDWGGTHRSINVTVLKSHSSTSFHL